MPRPICLRRIEGIPDYTLFKPAGIPSVKLELIVLAFDEIEALRLVDLEGMYQEQAAERMNVSRRTFARILDSAHKKVALALVRGKALKIEGGTVEMNQRHAYGCRTCEHQWVVRCTDTTPTQCPECHSAEIARADTCCGDGPHHHGQGHGHGHGHGHGPCCQR